MGLNLLILLILFHASDGQSGEPGKTNSAPPSNSSQFEDIAVDASEDARILRRVSIAEHHGTQDVICQTDLSGPLVRESNILQLIEKISQRIAPLEESQKQLEAEKDAHKEFHWQRCQAS
ncbi:MAG: hypothetical protein ABIQ95_01255 [Bdellovibrionia bacterium]